MAINNSERHIPLYDSRSTRGDDYQYHRFTEIDSAELTKIAQEVHALGYLGEGFVNQDAVDNRGALADDIDKARGDTVEYYLGLDSDMVPRSTIRKIRIRPGEGLHQLPAYKLCEDTLYAEDREYLLNIDNPHRTVREISAFAHTPEVTSKAGFELLRNILHDALGSGEVWFFSMVSDRYEALVRSFGPVAVRRIGENVAIDDPRVNGVELTPAIVDTDRFLKQVYDSVMSETNPGKRKIMMSRLYYFTEGLSDSEMGLEIAALREQIQAQVSQNELAEPVAGSEDTASDYGSMGLIYKINSISAPNKEWVEPDVFDMSSWADRNEIERRIDDGRITKSIDKVDEIADELFDLRAPEYSGDDDARAEFIADIQAQGERFGKWVNFPWSGELVRFADSADHQDLRTFRNRNLITVDEQARLLRAKIAVFGLSVGSNVVDELVRGGIGGTMIMGDYDTISPTNLNRIRADMSDVGSAKVDVAAKKISRLDPYIQQVHMRSGITTDAMEQLAELQPDIIFDEIDNFAMKALLRVFARQHHIPLVMVTDVGDKALVDIERHDLGQTKLFNGRLSEKEIDEIINDNLSPERRAKLMANIVGLSNASFRLIDSTLDSTLGGISQLGTTAADGGSKAAIAAREILLGRKLKSGRRMSSAKKILGLEIPDPLTQNIDTLRRFVDSQKTSR